MNEQPSLEQVEDFVFKMFVDQTYFIITSVTTIGYGDQRPNTQWERLYIMFVQFFGILIFTEYKVAITTIDKPISVDSMVLKSRADVQNYLYDISQLRERKKVLEGEIYDDAALFIEETIRYSTRLSFKYEFPFWKIMPPRIKI